MVRWKVLVGAASALLFLVYLNNTSSFAPAMTGAPTVLVHRGIAQQVNWDTADASGCIADQIFPPKHEYLENTIASMRAAFDRGANVVEFDIHRTRDNRFAVFHDRQLECRTDGQGAPREHSLEELQALDIGYGYTADGGRTYPFRGKGVGLMPSIDEVFQTFPGKSFLIDVKSNDPRDGRLLASQLSKLPPEQRSSLMVFGRGSTLEALRESLPEIRMFSVGSIANCLVRYIGYGWTGMVPGSCENAPLFVPVNIAPWLWGWPNLFMERMRSSGSSIVLVGAFSGRNFARGLDTLEHLARLPGNFDGGIWTNDVELVTTTLRKTSDRKQDPSLH